MNVTARQGRGQGAHCVRLSSIWTRIAESNYLFGGPLLSVPAGLAEGRRSGLGRRGLAGCSSRGSNKNLNTILAESLKEARFSKKGLGSVRAVLLAALLLAISVKSIYAATIPTITLAPSQSSVFTITQSDNLWYFNGAHGSPTYKTFVYLKAVGPTQGSFTWQATTRPQAVNLGNGSGRSVTFQNYPILGIESSDISGSVGDVTIHFQYNGLDVGDYPFTVYATQSVQLFSAIQNSAISGGYSSVGIFEILDQFGNLLTDPGLSFHEQFDSSSRVNVYAGNSWPTPTAVPGTVLENKIPGTSLIGFQDTWAAANLTNPTSINPCTPSLCTTEVFNLPQRYFLGSITTGQGRQVGFQTLHYFTDHAGP